MQNNPRNSAMDKDSMDPQTSGELDVWALASLLWAGKWTIAAILGLTISLTLGYFYLSPPVFQATAKLVPPIAADLVPLNALESVRDGDPITSSSAFSLGVSTLQRTVAQIKNPELNNDGLAGLERADFKLSLQKSPKNMPVKQVFEAKLTVKHPDADRARELAKDVIQLANRDAVNRLKDDIDAVANALLHSKKREIDSLDQLQSDNQASQLVALQARLELENLERIVANDYSSTSTMVLAQPIAMPSKPQRQSLKVLLALGLVGGFCLGAGVVLVRSLEN